MGAKGKGLKKTAPEPVEDEGAKDMEDQNDASLPEGKVMTKGEV